MKDRADGIQVVLCSHVEHGVILIVKLAVCFRALGIAAQQVVVEVQVRLQMPLGIHQQEAGVLQKARIDPSQKAWIVQRHAHDQVVLKPLVGLADSEAIYFGGTLARVNRAAHQDQRARHTRIILLRQKRSRRQDRHRRLTHCHHLGLRAQVTQKIHHIVDVVIKVERAQAQRHSLRVGPVGDIDVKVGQRSADGIAQQGGKVPRQRRHD